MTETGGPFDRSGGALAAVIGALGSVNRGVRHAVRAIPGVRPIEAQAEAGGRLLRGEIEKRIDGAALPRPALSPPAPVAAADTVRGAPEARPATGETMRALLARSMRSTPADSRRALHEALVAELVPDEARILAALSDGSSYAMVHIAEPGIGSFQKRVLENASSVGRSAGVALPEYVHLYVSHLRRIGLVESGPEDHSLKDQYDILLTEPKLRATIASISKGPRGARIIRRTVRISDLGRELWADAYPPTDVDDHPAESPQSG